MKHLQSFESNKASRKLKQNLRKPDFEMTKLDILKSTSIEMPDDLLEFIWSWDYTHKSPYSQSWYNAPKDWDTKYVHGKTRVSDHWNFESKGKIHCITKQDPKQIADNKWHVGIYDENDNKYDIVKSYDKKPKHIRSEFKSREFKNIMK